MDEDDLVRELFWFTCAAATAVGLVGGLLTSVAGRWADEGRLIRLRQLGPLVWGEALLSDGLQRFRGYAWGGRTVLYRRDYGQEHLMSLGFSAEQAQVVAGRVTGHFELRRVDSGLAGTFVGRRFRLENDRLRDQAAAAPVPRAWQRA